MLPEQLTTTARVMAQLIRMCVRTLAAMLLIALALPVFAADAPAEQAAVDYPVGPGDLLKISVFNHPELAAELRVSAGGTITFPLLGEVKTGGLSVHQLERVLAQGLSAGGFMQQAQVTVLIEDYQSQRFAVLGQVNKPGQYPLMSRVNVVGALAAAGGVVNLVAADEATLLRRDGTHMSIDLISLFQGDPRQDVTLAAGDTLYVPKAAQFYIYGAVQRPGMYRLERGMTVSQAISAGGGLTPRGSDRRVVVRRRDFPGGKEHETSLNAADLVQPDDVLRVKEGLL
jgi:polysaccharide biosynthesis/export protein